ncbi:MAG: hypothetical protein FWD59_09875, partial [Micrococcales bacterium]|nr:hypothetical protein [Micrococcales bacterium]
MSKRTILAAVVAAGLVVPASLLSAAPAAAATYEWDRYSVVNTTTYTQGSWTDWVRETTQTTSKSGYPTLSISSSSGFVYSGTTKSITKANVGVSVYSGTATRANSWQYTSDGVLWTHYITATAKTTQSRGSTYYGTVTSTSSTAYPQNGASGSYWYVYRGTITPTYTFTLNPSTAHTFAQAAVGYGTPTARTTTVANTGNTAGTFSISTSSSNFVLNKTTTGSLAGGSSTTFTVTPKTGLGA